MDVAEFTRLHAELLKLEQEAEMAENVRCNRGASHGALEKRGVALTRLTPVGAGKTSMYGRTVTTFASSRGGPDGGFPLPASKIKSGDIVEMGTVGGGGQLSRLGSGVVVRTTTTTVAVAFEEPPSPPFAGRNLVMLKLANEVTYKRLSRTLNDLSGGGPRYASTPCPAAPVIRALFGGGGGGGGGGGSTATHSHCAKPLHTPRPIPASATTTSMPASTSTLNASQRAAVEFCLQGHPVCVIHGPPGTGKTTTVVELIAAMVACGLKVLAATSSNIAVDNLVERLGAQKELNVVRIGHPARLLETVQHLSLDAKVDASDEAGLVRDIRREMDARCAVTARVIYGLGVGVGGLLGYVPHVWVRVTFRMCLIRCWICA
jgi:ATP-dependent RNA/DNA helicase IGHMBP2